MGKVEREVKGKQREGRRESIERKGGETDGKGKERERGQGKDVESEEKWRGDIIMGKRGKGGIEKEAGSERMW